MRWLLIPCMVIACECLSWSPLVDSQEVPKVESLKRQLQTELDAIVAERKFPGATLAVVLDDGTTIDLASGMADPDAGQRLPVGASMFCGSTGKTFVSAVALQLVAEEKLQLDALASQYFDGPEDRAWFQRLPNAREITVRSLMNHTSGLPRYIFQSAFLEDLKANPQKSRSPRECLAFLLDLEPVHPCLGGWSYSDSNYLVLGLIIEQVTGKTYYDEATRRLLKPLKLTHTIPATQSKLPTLSQGHIGSDNPFELPPKTVHEGNYVLNPQFEWCGGGFVTTAGDLARWLQQLHGGQVLDGPLHDQLVAAVGFRDGQPAPEGYGLGSFVWQTELGTFWGHAGMMPGYLTQIEYSREHRFAIAFQTNTDQDMGRGLHQHVQAIAQRVSDWQSEQKGPKPISR